MTFIVKKASDYSFKEKREINTLEDLANLEKEFDPSDGLIISFNKKTYTDGPIIYIYDDYVE